MSNMTERKGIMLAGNILTDTVKMIPTFPEQGMLVTVSDIVRAVGGSVPNTGIDLAVIDPSLPLYACGKVGDDDNGVYVKEQMAHYGMDVSRVVTGSLGTSFSDVMTVTGTGARTFFHYRGANAEFSPADVDVEAIPSKMFHLGYLLLLDAMEEADAEYGNKAARLLAQVQAKGIKTSIDVVSESSGHFAEVVVPVLPYCDTIVINEIEACQISGNTPRDKDGKLLEDEVWSAMEFILSKGVKDCVVVHFPEAGMMLRKDGTKTYVPSVDIPRSLIKGSVGAGDAFCAGCLYGLYHGWDDAKILLFASGAAVCNLTEKDAISGLRSEAEIWKVCKEYAPEWVAQIGDVQ